MYCHIILEVVTLAVNYDCYSRLRFLSTVQSGMWSKQLNITLSTFLTITHFIALYTLGGVDEELGIAETPDKADCHLPRQMHRSCSFLYYGCILCYQIRNIYVGIP